MKRLFVTLALALPGMAFAQVTGNTQSSAQTASQSSAANQGNAQNLTLESTSPRNSSVKTNPNLVIPNMYGSFSQASCMVSASGGFSGGLIGIAIGGPIEDKACTQRLNSTLLMQMANNARPINADMADRFVRAATNNMCQISDQMYAVLADQGLCDQIDYQALKKQRRTISRSDALPTFPDQYTGG